MVEDSWVKQWLTRAELSLALVAHSKTSSNLADYAASEEWIEKDEVVFVS